MKAIEFIYTRMSPDKIEGSSHIVYVKRQMDNIFTMNADHAAPYMRFHFGVWLAAQEDVQYSICVAIEQAPLLNTRDADQFIVFKHKEDRDRFVEWRERINGWFHRGLEYEYIPCIPLEGTREISVVAHGEGNDWLNYDTYDKLFDQWVWIAHNCREPVWLIPGGFAFASSTDAVEFKLRQG